MDAGAGELSARCRLLAGGVAAVVDVGAGGLSAAYWRALLGRCQGAEVLQVREMESHEEFWADWLRQDNEYAIGDRKAIEAGGI